MSSAFLDGVLSWVGRKTGWLMAEQAGLERPYRMQSLLGRSRWDADVFRDAVRAYAVEALGDADGVLVVDETRFLKKGEHSVGVSRQYSGTAGRVENCQVGVFLAYASRYGQTLIDRRLYLPKGWVDDEARRASAQIPQEQAFATKPEIACDLIAAALDAGVQCAWVLAYALYGSDSRLRRMLEDRGQPYVLAVRSNHCLRFVRDHASADVATRSRPREWQARSGRQLSPRHPLSAQKAPDRQACTITVELLALAHDRGCERELAEELARMLDAHKLPDLVALRAIFGPGSVADRSCATRIAQ